ncbi:hypothetical protein F2P81_014575 [Scophthalmus maximus]|uniref:Uncharacterized protein n=1 Tax=Scophthalmus maximus TaxID=52904 RepID=A0A6A4SI60_SCOMX|nr:hypothetical protein F2P81_014575 [Scophthalmus maximus]
MDLASSKPRARTVCHVIQEIGTDILKMTKAETKALRSNDNTVPSDNNTVPSDNSIAINDGNRDSMATYRNNTRNDHSHTGARGPRECLNFTWNSLQNSKVCIEEEGSRCTLDNRQYYRCFPITTLLLIFLYALMHDRGCLRWIRIGSAVVAASNADGTSRNS